MDELNTSHQPCNTRTAPHHNYERTDQPIDLTAAIELLADDYARLILQCLDEETLSASEISDRCDISQVTVYRRLDRLEEAGLLTVNCRPAADGNHYNVYRNALQTLTLSVCSDGFDGTIVTD